MVYVKELFAKIPGRMNIERFTVPETVDKVIIAELEIEETFIEKLSVDKKVLHERVTLHRGDFLEIKVKAGSSFEIAGRYTTRLSYQLGANRI
jgi:hypothetical protein